MKVKVLCDALIYNGQNFSKGKEIEIVDKKTVEKLLKEKSVEEVKEPKKAKK